jgi:hypothetical protein
MNTVLDILEDLKRVRSSSVDTVYTKGSVEESFMDISLVSMMEGGVYCICCCGREEGWCAGAEEIVVWCFSCSLSLFSERRFVLTACEGSLVILMISNTHV